MNKKIINLPLIFLGTIFLYFFSVICITSYHIWLPLLSRFLFLLPSFRAHAFTLSLSSSYWGKRKGGSFPNEILRAQIAYLPTYLPATLTLSVLPSNTSLLSNIFDISKPFPKNKIIELKSSHVFRQGGSCSWERTQCRHSDSLLLKGSQFLLTMHTIPSGIRVCVCVRLCSSSFFTRPLFFSFSFFTISSYNYLLSCAITLSNTSCIQEYERSECLGGKWQETAKSDERKGIICSGFQVKESSIFREKNDVENGHRGIGSNTKLCSSSVELP